MKLVNPSHKLGLTTIKYDNFGIHLSPFLNKNQYSIPWSNIEVCSPTPGPKEQNGTWVQYNGDPYSLSKFLSLSFVIRNRHQLFDRYGSLRKWWLNNTLFLNPLYGSDDKPLQEKGLITIDVNLQSLSLPVADFIGFLHKHIRFELIVYDF